MLAPVQRANHNKINNPLLSSKARYGANENEATNHKTKLNKIVILVANFPVNFLYPGFMKFTIVVIIVDITTKAKKMFDIFLKSNYIKSLSN